MLVERRRAVRADAFARYLEHSGSREARERLDDAEEILYVAEYELGRARRALERAEARSCAWLHGMRRSSR